MPGLSNRDARRAFDARVAALRAALESGDDDALGRGLGEALQLELWRARKLTGFEALAEDVVGLAAPHARKHAERWATESGHSLERLPETAVALWLRAEVVLAALCPSARVRIDGAATGLSIELPDLSPDEAARVLGSLARTARELDRVMQTEGQARPSRKGPPRRGPRERS